VGKIKSTSETSSTGSSDDKDIKVEDGGLETNVFAGDDNCKASGLEGQSLQSKFKFDYNKPLWW
jgi:hypothetical protein